LLIHITGNSGWVREQWLWDDGIVALGRWYCGFGTMVLWLWDDGMVAWETMVLWLWDDGFWMIT